MYTSVAYASTSGEPNTHTQNVPANTSGAARRNRSRFSLISANIAGSK